MRRELQRDEAFKGHQHERKEWSHSADREHQFEAREHARQSGRSLKTYGVRNDEAARQIRELRARY